MLASELKKDFYVSFPSKTFLIGEYAVLEKSPALLVNTRPRFQFYVKLSKNSKHCQHPFHKESPAGMYIEKNKNLFSGICISKVKNKEKYFGGFGSSSAEFNCVYLIKKSLEGESYKNINIFQLWKAYKEVSQNTSGADVLSQWRGGLCFISFDPFKLETFPWFFKKLDFVLIHTKEILHTSKHISSLNHQDFSSLKKTVCNLLSGKSYLEEDKFISSINQYSKCLRDQGWVSSVTQSVLKKYREHPSVLAAKGCGAKGAGPIIFFVKKGEDKSFLKNEHIVASSKDIDLQGVQVHKKSVRHG